MGLALVVLAFLFGSVPFGALITQRVAHKDIRELGSGNIGATNVARVVGKSWALLVLLLDVLKGALPTLLCIHLLKEQFEWHATTGTCAMLGHVFSPWLKFKGGKGVATFLGVIGCLLPLALLFALVLYVLIFSFSRIGSLSSLVAVAAAIISSVLLPRVPLAYTASIFVMAIVIVVRHRENIFRLLKSEEGKL